MHTYIVENNNVFDTLDKIVNDNVTIALVINGENVGFDTKIVDNFMKEHTNWDMLCITKPCEYTEMYPEFYNKVIKIKINENIFPSMFLISKSGCENRENVYMIC